MKRFINILLGSLIIAYLFLAFSYKEQEKNKLQTKELRIVLHGKNSYKLISNKSIYTILKKHNIHKQKNNIYNVDKENIELLLKKHKYIREAEVSIDANFQMVVEIKQAEPLFRVITKKKNYYVDKERNILPIKQNVHANVYIAIGKITNKMAENELYNLFSKVEEDKVWDALLDYAYIDENKEVILYVFGMPKVYFGKIENIEEKLQNLFAFIKHTSNTLDFTKYSMFDVRFKNQIIAKKKYYD